MPPPLEWNLPIFDGRVRPPLMVTHDLGARGCQGGVPRDEGSSLMAPSPKVISSPGGVAGAEIWPQTMGVQPTKNDRAQFRFLLNQHKEHATRQGCQQLHLESGVQRKDAHRFYEREGMTMSSLHFVEIIAPDQGKSSDA